MISVCKSSLRTVCAAYGTRAPGCSPATTPRSCDRGRWPLEGDVGQCHPGQGKVTAMRAFLAETQAIAESSWDPPRNDLAPMARLRPHEAGGTIDAS